MFYQMMWTKKNRIEKFEKKNVVSIHISNWAKFL